ncbi:putative 6-deoxyerythronolide-B synthase [Rhodotorula taiwanensis]|uniref:Putative 6-deoxyerythronolide-B synthase n=1 Tax=Rhodotorula taiwanensis TaxID=741276 RepID=A0A2S5BBV0_9BASI|nr:putative 6-deoxyerythronolide-B synthase [Rhodotorula taiwanensis]
MKYVAAYLLAVTGGNASPKAEDIKTILGAADVSVDEERLSKLLAELEGKDINEIIAEGSKKLASVPSGGAAPAAAAGAAAGGATDAPAEKEKEEEKEESDDDMGFGLFD